MPCSVAQYRAEILTIFESYFGRNDDFKNLFGNLLTFIYFPHILHKLLEYAMR